MELRRELQRKRLTALMVEDSPVDAMLIGGLLEQSQRPPIDIVHAVSLAEACAVLRAQSVDLVLLDLTLGDSSGLSTLNAVLVEAPDAAVVVMTGDNDEEIGLSAVARGAQDFLVKGEISGTLLLRSICYAVERSRLAGELRQAVRKIKTLHGLLPICSRCKKIRDDGGYWQEVECYIHDHSAASFSHSFCPVCADALIAEAE
jgi:DNA-binding NarL/FixJ family response regulator